MHFGEITLESSEMAADSCGDTDLESITFCFVHRRGTVNPVIHF